MSRRAFSLGSWIFWFVWMFVGLAFELFAVYAEKKHGTLPLTRVLRDRLMRKSVIARLGMLLFLGWLSLHFLVGGPTPVPW